MTRNILSYGIHALLPRPRPPPLLSHSPCFHLLLRRRLLQLSTPSPFPAAAVAATSLASIFISPPPIGKIGEGSFEARAQLPRLPHRSLISRRQLRQVILHGTMGGGDDVVSGMAHATSLVVCAWEGWLGVLRSLGRARARSQDRGGRASTRAIVAWEQRASVEQQQGQQEQLRQHTRRAYASKLATAAGKARERQLVSRVWAAWGRRAARFRCASASGTPAAANSRSPRQASVHTRVSLLGRQTVTALRRFAGVWIAPMADEVAARAERLALLREVLAGWCEWAGAGGEERALEQCGRRLEDLERILTISLAFARTLARQVCMGVRAGAGGVGGGGGIEMIVG
jgi:hypothetical protein